MSQGNGFELVKTDTIKVLISQLPYESTYTSYMCQVLEPVKMIPKIRTYSSAFSLISETPPLEKLKEQLLAEWHAHFKHVRREMKKADAMWVYDVNKVELIECDLLVPKSLKCSVGYELKT